MKWRLPKIKKEIQKIVTAWSNANVGMHGAAVAYYTVFSIAPLLIITVALAAVFVNASYIQSGIIHQFEWMFGSDTAGFINSLITASRTESANVFMVGVGIIAIIIGATGIFAAIQAGLNNIFQTLPEKKSNGIWKMIFQRLALLSMVLLLGITLLASLLISTGITALRDGVEHYIPQISYITVATEFFVSLALISLFLTLLVRYLPSHRIRWQPAAASGMIGGLLFMIGKYVLGWYLGTSGAASAYGTASSIVLLILWAFYLSQAFFFSAVVGKLYFTKK